MNNERCKYPRVELDGQVNVLVAGIVRYGTIHGLSPSGVQIECQHQLIEQLDSLKSDAGLYPDIELEFSLPISNKQQRWIKSKGYVAYCRRLSQELYLLGLNFSQLSDADESKVSAYIDKLAA
jgi:hypothetical protein